MRWIAIATLLVVGIGTRRTAAAPQPFATYYTPSASCDDHGTPDIALGPDHVYWATQGVVRRRAKQGGAIEDLAVGQEGSLATDGADVYWVTYRSPLRRLRCTRPVSSASRTAAAGSANARAAPATP
jgi:hypothetical protein